jgi:hypothetical protein
MLMLATLTLLDSTVTSRAAVVLPELHGGGRQERGADAANERRPLCGELADRCLTSGCPIAAMVKAAREARTTGATG